MICDYCGKDTATLDYGKQHLCIYCHTKATQGTKEIEYIETNKHGEYQMEEKDFDTQLKEMCEIRKKNEWDEYNSPKGQANQIITDFKCWAFSKGKFNNLDINLFTQYTKEVKLNITENMKRYIAERYFGYEFTFTHKDMKWHITKHGNLVLNPN